MVDIYVKEELKAAIAYMKSRHGASAIAENAEFARRYAKFISRSLRNALQNKMVEPNAVGGSEVTP